MEKKEVNKRKHKSVTKRTIRNKQKNKLKEINQKKY